MVSTWLIVKAKLDRNQVLNTVGTSAEKSPGGTEPAIDAHTTLSTREPYTACVFIGGSTCSSLVVAMKVIQNAFNFVS